MPTSRYAKTKHVLAARIGISRPALYRLFARGDYPPITNHGWDVEQWQRYADNNIATWNRRSKNGTNGNGNGAHKLSPNPKEAAYIARQQISAQKEQFDLDVKREKYELKSETRGVIASGFSMLTRELDKALRHELPPRLEGLSAGDIAKLLGKRFDEIRERVAKSLEGANGHAVG